MEQQEFEFKQVLRVGLIVGALLVGAVVFFMSWNDVNPGEEGFVYRPYSGGIDQEESYTEGTYFIAPWNEIITYNVLQHSKQYSSKVMERNGMEIGIDIIVNYNPTKGKCSELHLKHGIAYETSYVDAKVKGVIRDVIGRFTYSDIYKEKRDSLEYLMAQKFRNDFPDNFLTFNFCEITDVDLPNNVKTAITEKETQKQQNQKAEQLKIYESELADARIEKSRGDSALVVSARFKAEAIQLEAEQIGKNPQYIELKKWESWDGIGSPYGNGNVFGDKAISILKQQ
jgi:regulator of protease activity HflC (stomatin/prohibitin superfamily)